MGDEVALVLVQKDADGVVIGIDHRQIGKRSAAVGRRGKGDRIVAHSKTGFGKGSGSGQRTKDGIGVGGSGAGAGAGAEASGQKRKRDGIAVTYEECGRLAVLRAQQNLPAAAHQGERVGKIGGYARQR